MISQPSLAFNIFQTFAPNVFQTKYPVVQPVIDQCRGEGNCSHILRCILDRVFSDYPARWSAGASILGFIPTIVGLMSNSIDEVTAIAEESMFLAIAISISSVTVFSTRLGDKITSAKQGYPDSSSDCVQMMREKISMLLENNKQRHTGLWRNTKIQDACLGIAIIGCSTLVWYELFEVSRYGIITFACPVKFTVILWAILGQSLTLLNISLRHHSFRCRKISVKDGRARRTLNEPMIDSSEMEEHPEYCVIILRSPHSTWQRRILQFMTAVFSFSIYTFGTVILASMTMFEAADAVRVVVVVAITAGFGRVVGYWALSSIRSGKKAILVDVPTEHIGKLFEMISEELPHLQS